MREERKERKEMRGVGGKRREFGEGEEGRRRGWRRGGEDRRGEESTGCSGQLSPSTPTTEPVHPEPVRGNERRCPAEKPGHAREQPLLSN